jgi:hypothetical protein
MTVRLVWDSTGIDGGANTTRIYIDDVLGGSDNSAIPGVSQTDLRIGNNSQDLFFCNAKIKELKIWNEVVLP